MNYGMESSHHHHLFTDSLWVIAAKLKIKWNHFLFNLMAGDSEVYFVVLIFRNFIFCHIETFQGHR